MDEIKDDGVTPNHDRRGKFKPGNRANPGGSPTWLKGTREMLRNLVPEAIERLAGILRNGDDKNAVAAAKVILEYTVTKPTMKHRIEGGAAGPLAGLTLAELLAVGRAAKGEAAAAPNPAMPAP